MLVSARACHSVGLVPGAFAPTQGETYIPYTLLCRGAGRPVSANDGPATGRCQWRRSHDEINFSVDPEYARYLMATNLPIGPGERIRHELEALRSEWYWFLALGILLIVAGTIAIGHSVLATVVAVKLLGLLLVVAGVAQIISSFWTGRWTGFLLSVLVGILYVVVGGEMATKPLEAGLALTLLIGSFLLVEGIFRVVAALSLRMHHYGWILLNGVITALLGLMVLAEFPESGLWVIGLFVGIEMLFNGWTWVMLALGLRSVHLQG